MEIIELEKGVIIWLPRKGEQAVNISVSLPVYFVKQMSSDLNIQMKERQKERITVVYDNPPKSISF